MRIVSYSLAGRTSYGILDASHSLEDFENAAVADIPSNVPGAPAGISEFLERFEELCDATSNLSPGPLTFRELSLLPVIPHPPNIIAIGVNYVDHASETGDQVPDYPLIFTKFTSSISAHGSDIRIPQDCQLPDYEAELGIVIGKPASNVAKEDALAHVGGYFTFNDVSARDYQNRTSQWVQGKGFPTFAPTGPFLVTPDEFGLPGGRAIRLRIGDEVLQEANTDDMVFDVATIVSYVSGVCDLRPGDVIATGTPSGVGVARSPMRLLGPGDMVSVEIDGLPTLVNRVTAS